MRVRTFVWALLLALAFVGLPAAPGQAGPLPSDTWIITAGPFIGEQLFTTSPEGEVGPNEDTGSEGQILIDPGIPGVGVYSGSMRTGTPWFVLVRNVPVINREFASAPVIDQSDAIMNNLRAYNAVIGETGGAADEIIEATQAMTRAINGVNNAADAGAITQTRARQINALIRNAIQLDNRVLFGGLYRRGQIKNAIVAAQQAKRRAMQAIVSANIPQL